MNKEFFLGLLFLLILTSRVWLQIWSQLDLIMNYDKSVNVRKHEKNNIFNLMIKVMM